MAGRRRAPKRVRVSKIFITSFSGVHLIIRVLGFNKIVLVFEFGDGFGCCIYLQWFESCHGVSILVLDFGWMFPTWPRFRMDECLWIWAVPEPVTAPKADYFYFGIVGFVI